MKTKRNRITSLFVALVMIFTMIPTTAMAATSEPKIIQSGSGMEMTETLEYIFESDPAAIGEWVTYDFIETIPEKYDPNRKARQSDVTDGGYYLGHGIYQDGTAQTYRAGGTDYDSWTKGYLVWRGSWNMVPGYKIQVVDGRSFMFVEWKSGDYRREGKITGYYVLEKLNGNATDPNAEENFVIRDGVLVRYLGTGKNLHVVVPEGVTELAGRAFSFNDGIVEVTLPNSLIEVYPFAFYADKFLTTINVGTGSADIYQNPYQGSWFQCCDSLTNINIAEGNKFMHDVDGVPFLTAEKELIYYPQGRTAKSYTIPDGTVSVRLGSFNNWPWLVEVTVPGSVKETDVDSFSVPRLIIEDGAIIENRTGAREYVFLTHDANQLRQNLAPIMDKETKPTVYYNIPEIDTKTLNTGKNVMTFKLGQPSDYSGALYTDEADTWAIPTINAAADKDLISLNVQFYYTFPLYRNTLSDLSKSFIEVKSGKYLIDVLHDAGKDLIPFNVAGTSQLVTGDLVSDVVMQLGIFCDNLPTEPGYYGTTAVDMGSSVTREQLAETAYKLAIMFNLGDMTKTPAKVPSDMSSVTSTRTTAVNFCLANGLINAGGNGNFNPKGEVTRQEAIVVLYRLSELAQSK